MDTLRVMKTLYKGFSGSNIDGMQCMPAEKRQQLEHILEEIKNIGSIYVMLRSDYDEDGSPIYKPRESKIFYIGPKGIYTDDIVRYGPDFVSYEEYGTEWAFTKEELE